MIRAGAVLLIAALLTGAELAVAQAWSRATVAGQEAGALYLRISGGEADDRLLAAESPAAAVVEVHEHAKGADGVLRMQQVAGGLAIPARGTVELKPGSYHIMLIGLKAPLAKGAQVQATLVFAKAGRRTVAATVLDPWAMAYDER